MTTTDENKKDNVSEPDDGDRILPLEQITIKHVFRDGVPITNDLLSCFFAPQGVDEYMFFAGNGEQKGNGGIKGGQYFSFKMAEEIWVLKAHFDAKKATAHGDWHSFGPDGTDDGGTFTAQAGGGADLTSYASA